MDGENFPRGGRINNKSTKRKHQDALFNKVESPHKKKIRKTIQNDVNMHTEVPWKIARLFESLSYDKMQEGMIILSCIRHISNLALQIEFPGLAVGLVTINQISDHFTNKLVEGLYEEGSEECYSALRRMFKVGSLVPAKILTIKHTDKGHEVLATLNPKDINAHKVHRSFKKGMTVWASVTSQHDHGYELSVSVKNCRVFLPHKNIDNWKKYAVGELLYCVIHKAETSDLATTLIVSAKHDHINKVQVTDDLNLDDIIPGTKVEFLINEVLPHGIKGFFLDNCLGYIDESQIFSKVKINKMVEGSTLMAYVLFVEPVTKITYLALRGLDNLHMPHYELGKIISAEVLKLTSRGLYLKLGKDSTGFVTNKRLLNTLTKNANLNLINAVHKKYPKGSRHSCRILDYNYIQQLYICTLEQKIIKEEIFNSKDLKIGQKVTVKIEKVISNGLIVKTGYLQGFVPNMHLSNVKYSYAIKRKYSVGAIVDARVINITSEGNVIFTLKQSLIESDKCLTNIEDAISGHNYVGFIVQTKISGALVAFYGDAKGWISNRVLNSGNTECYMDPRNFFFIGQVVSVWVIGFRNNKPQLSLNYPHNKKMKIKVGEKLNGTITTIRSDSVDVEVDEHKIDATIPVAHLSSNMLLSNILLKQYKIGDSIENIVCIRNKDIPVMSRRECLAYERDQIRVPKFRDLEKNMLMRCSFEGYTDLGIFVSIPIMDYDEKILILKQNISFDGEFYLGLQKHQCILANISDIDYNSRNIVLNTNVNKDIHAASKLLTSHIEDLNQIIRICQENNVRLTQYEIGERVKCKVNKIDNEGNCLVNLPNKINGLIAVSLRTSNIRVGDVIESVILDYNFVDNYVEVCCRNDIKQKINPVQGGIIKKSMESFCMAEVLLHTKFYVIGVLRDSQCNRQLVYLPSSFNENDNNSLRMMYKEKVKVYLQRKVGSRIIGLPKKFVTAGSKTMVMNNEKSKKINLGMEDKKHQNIHMYNTNSTNTDEDCDKFTFKEKSTIVEHVNMTSIENDVLMENREYILPGVNSFYELENSNNIDESEEETEIEETIRRKRKVTPQERNDVAKREEERILTLEKELSKIPATPENAEQFDRLLLANPNSSELWTKYIAMHVATAELDKARAIGKKALGAINMTLVEEKFNIWIALLNLENMYGTKESFEKTFEDAVKFNDSLDIYLNVIKLLATAGKLTEMEDKIKKIKSKEKQNSKMWLEIAQVYYSLGKFQEAQKIKENALKSILDKKKQYDLMIKFGIMEFHLGDLEQAVADFEAFLNIFPSKINIWMIYIDQLIKKKRVDQARNLLKRASNQRFSLRNMKTIFQKFINFEEQHGTPESVEHVKNKARQYVMSVNVE